MASVMRGDREASAATDELTRRAESLERAVDLGGNELDPAAVARARAVLTRIRERLGLGGAQTVVALAGATGSGKSSLFNALVGAPIATVGARRPTTSSPTAAVWGAQPAAELLDWVGVSVRHDVPAVGEDPLRGLVLLDLPDFDSRESAHRAEAERILALVDVFVYVTDPQKYADAVLHNDFLAAGARHSEVTVVVLNHTDELAPGDLGPCLADLRELLSQDGLPAVQVLDTSARTGHGIPALRELLADVTSGRAAARQRLTGDVQRVASAVRTGVGDTEAAVPETVTGQLVDALSRSAGLPVVLDAVQRDYQRQASSHTGWVFSRWVQRLRPDPLKRLRLDPAHVVDESDVRAILGRSSIPAPSPAAKAGLALATHQLGDSLSVGMPFRWATAVQNAAEPGEADLADALDLAVRRTPIRLESRPWWWLVCNAIQWQLAICALAGLLWLAVLSVLGWFQLPKPDVPTWGVVPIPLLLLVGGVLLGLGFAALARPLSRIGARRRRAAVAARLDDSVREVAEQRITEPVRAVVERHRSTREALDEALA